MDKPCETCIVKSRCSQRCEDYAKYVYETKDYKFAGEEVSLHIKNMSYEDAIKHILTVENVYLYMKMIDDQYDIKFTSALP